MHNHLEALSVFQVVLAFGLIVLSLFLMARMRIPLLKDLLIGAMRSIGQLLAIGYILSFLFHCQQWFWIVGYLVFMALVSGATVRGRLKPERRKGAFWAIQLSLWLGTGLTLAWVSQVVLQVHPWYSPQFIIPLAGMLLGNNVNSATLSLERFHSELKIRRSEIETLLSLGATPKQAAHDSFKAAMMAGMIPNINAMMVVGIVSLPGMMTGQMLAGQLPLAAVTYQIMVMFMITGSASITLSVLLLLARRKAFNNFEQLRAITS